MSAFRNRTIPSDVPPPPVTTSEMVSRVRGIFVYFVLSYMAFSLFMQSGSVTGNLFNYHPIAMSVVMLLALPGVLQTITSLQNPKESVPKEEKVLRHQIAVLVLQLCFAAGIWSVFSHKKSNQKAHFTSPHGKVGAISGVALLVEATLGALLRYGISERSPSRATVKQLHKLFSFIFLTTSVLAYMGGLMSAYNFQIMSGHLTLTLALGTLASIVIAVAF